MTDQTPAFTWLSPQEILALAAEVEASGLEGDAARDELHRRLAELQERRYQRWTEEWLTDERRAR